MTTVFTQLAHSSLTMKTVGSHLFELQLSNTLVIQVYLAKLQPQFLATFTEGKFALVLILALAIAKTCNNFYGQDKLCNECQCQSGNGLCTCQCHAPLYIPFLHFYKNFPV